MKTETTASSVSPKEMPETANSTRIQTYSKSQLATLYLPHIQPASARRTLRSWIPKIRHYKPHSPKPATAKRQSYLLRLKLDYSSSFWENPKKQIRHGKE